jgi:hypothetical protein
VFLHKPDLKPHFRAISVQAVVMTQIDQIQLQHHLLFAYQPSFSLNFFISKNFSAADGPKLGFPIDYHSKNIGD